MDIRFQRLAKLNQETYEQIARLMPQLNDSIPTKPMSHFVEIIGNKDLFFFGMFDEEKLVGIATVATFKIPTGQRTVLEDMVIDGACQGQGLGKHFMNYIIEYCRDAGLSDINLTSNPNRIGANMLYQAVGFELREANNYRLVL